MSGCEHPAMITVEKAQSYLLERARVVQEVEQTEISLSLGRVLACTQLAEIDVPGFDNSSMDGYALRSADAQTEGACELRVVQRVAAGQSGRELGPGKCGGGDSGLGWL